jgi:hypothetical protein
VTVDAYSARLAWQSRIGLQHCVSRLFMQAPDRDVRLAQAEVATRSFLTSVHEMLTSSTEEMWDAAAWRIKELLNTIPFKGEDFIQVGNATLQPWL